MRTRWLLALLLTLTTLGCAYLGPRDPARKADGMWQERFPAENGSTKLVSLWLQPQGRATLETVTLGQQRPADPQIGRWTFRDDNQLTVQLQDEMDKPVGEPMVFDLVGDRLVPKRWDKNLYGPDGLALRRRVN